MTERFTMDGNATLHATTKPDDGQGVILDVVRAFIQRSHPITLSARQDGDIWVGDIATPFRGESTIAVMGDVRKWLTDVPDDDEYTGPNVH